MLGPSGFRFRSQSHPDRTFQNPCDSREQAPLSLTPNHHQIRTSTRAFGRHSFIQRTSGCDVLKCLLVDAVCVYVCTYIHTSQDHRFPSYAYRLWAYMLMACVCTYTPTPIPPDRRHPPLRTSTTVSSPHPRSVVVVSHPESALAVASVAWV